MLLTLISWSSSLFLLILVIFPPPLLHLFCLCSPNYFILYNIPPLPPLLIILSLLPHLFILFLLPLPPLLLILSLPPPPPSPLLLIFLPLLFTTPLLLHFSLLHLFIYYDLSPISPMFRFHWIG